MERFYLDIAGEARPAADGQWFEATNPATGRPWALVARATREDALAAVEAAATAWGNWRLTSGAERARLLCRLGDLVEANRERLALAETLGNGKTITETRGQMAGLARYFHYYAGFADKLEGAVIPVEDVTAHVYAEWEPVGVCVFILPWNSPLPLCAQKLAPALATGNTVIIKPSEFTSTSIAVLMELIREAGFPPGVVNVVTGPGADIGEALISAPETALVAFTGGEAAGAAVAACAGRNLKPITLELGGKSPQLVFADADLESAAHGVIQGIFASTGQSCVAGSRLLVHHSLQQALIERIVALVAKLKIGDPLDAATRIGPIATAPQLDRVLRYFEIAAADGASLVTGGTRIAPGDGEQGYFVEPTIYADVRSDMRIAREEVFGPLLSVIEFGDEDEAVALANDSHFGLAAGIWSRDGARVHRVARKLQCGIVWANCYRTSSVAMPFGGFKRSGIGREGGSAMIRDYLQQKAVWINTRDGFTASLAS
ncbi:aldehyde dehydrogenase [Boseaceae bacterium BT-24-1]|nr:aldehyde dehydrogenase [Boseaceae bacterium BT-24-1]